MIKSFRRLRLSALSIAMIGALSVTGVVSATALAVGALPITSQAADPVIGVQLSPDRLVEEDAGNLVVTLSLNQALSAAVDVVLDTGVQEGLAEYDVFRARLPTGVRLRGVDAAKQRITLGLPSGQEGPVVVTVPVFDDPAADGEVVSTWTVAPGTGYTVDPTASSASVVLVDGDTNARPTVPDAAFRTGVGALLSVPAPGVLTGAVDPEGEPLTAALGSIRPRNGTATVQADGSFTYQPTGGFEGEDRFTVRAGDGNWTSKEATITVAVGPEPTPTPTTTPASTTPVATTTTATTAAPEGPRVSLVVEPVTAAEVGPDGQAQQVTFRLSLDESPPAGESVTVYVLADVSQALTQLDLFGLQVQHDGLTPGEGPAPVGDFDFTGFTLELVSGGATVTVPTFDDAAEEPPTTVTFSVVPFEDVPWGGDELGADPPIQATGPYRLGDPASDTLVLVDRLDVQPTTTPSPSPTTTSPTTSTATTTSEPTTTAPTPTTTTTTSEPTTTAPRPTTTTAPTPTTTPGTTTSAPPVTTTTAPTPTPTASGSTTTGSTTTSGTTTASTAPSTASTTATTGGAATPTRPAIPTAVPAGGGPVDRSGLVALAVGAALVVAVSAAVVPAVVRRRSPGRHGG